jgi:group I intron endonuclease
MDIVSGVYQITNTVNGHRYIGSAVNFKKRWDVHRRSLSKGNHHSSYLQRAWNKYGSDCFEFSVIENCEKPILIQREQFYMDTWHPEYNVSPTAGSPLGTKHSEETKKKVSAAGKGRKFSEEHKQKISNALKGRTFSEQTKAKIGRKSIGRVFSDEARKKMSEAGKRREHKRGYQLSSESKQKIRDSLIGNKRSLGRTSWNKGKTGLWFASNDTRQKMSETRKGKKHTEESKRKMSKAKKKWWEARQNAHI